MIPKPILTILVYALPILIVSFGVLMGGFMLASAMQDTVGSLVLRWIATACLLFLAADLLLLVGALGVNALGQQPPRDDGDS